MKNTIILSGFLALCPALLIGGLVTPEDNAAINYIHVLFEWDQVPDAEAYRIQASNQSDFSTTVFDETDSTLVLIDRDNFEWDSQYYWRVQPLFSDGSSGGWTESNSFSTGQQISSAITTFHNSNHSIDDITIFGSFFNYFSAAIDGSGKEIWNSGDKNLVYYGSSIDGDRFGFYYVTGSENQFPAVEFDVNTDYIWEEPNIEFVHHEFIKLPNGNYMGIVSTTQVGPIAIGSWTPQFQALGYVADGVTPEFIWVGDKIVEWDKDSKDVVWSWNVFDHFDMADYDDKGGTWDQAFIDLQYDWTHANALAFSDEDSTIYLSVRHLSRITKIDYSTGNVMWNLGHEMPSGDVTMGTDIGFSFQHGLQVLDNGNIVTFDNGNLSQIFLNTSDPTSRGLEIDISGSSGNCTAEIAWEYNLPENLFGFASGNAQKLEADKYLITTVGDGGTSLEVDSAGNILWEADYNLSLPNGAIYRANRIPGMHPSAFSVLVDDLREYEENPSVVVTVSNPNLSFRIVNESRYDMNYTYSVTDVENWFSGISGSLSISSGSDSMISVTGNVADITSSNGIQLTVTPANHEEDAKTTSLNGYTFPLSTEFNSSPIKFQITIIYPNPFNARLQIDFDIGNSDKVEIAIFDVTGRVIATHAFNNNSSGKNSIILNSVNWSSGMYFVKIFSQDKTDMKKAILIK